MRKFARRPRRGRLAATGGGDQGPSPLANKTAATGADKLRWGTLALGRCLSDPAGPATTSPGPPAASSAPVLPAAAAPRYDGPLLQPTPDDPNAEVEDCPRCAAAVLPSDESCSNCGLRRAERVVGRERLSEPGPGTFAYSGDAVKVVAKVQQRIAVDALACDVPQQGGGAAGGPPALKSCLRARARTSSPIPRISFREGVEVVEIKTYRAENLWWPAPSSRPKALSQPARASTSPPPPGAPASGSASSHADGTKPRRGRPPGSLNKRKTATVDNADIGIDGMRWHGGTLVPPPYMLRPSTGPVATETPPLGEPRLLRRQTSPDPVVAHLHDGDDGRDPGLEQQTDRVQSRAEAKMASLLERVRMREAQRR